MSFSFNMVVQEISSGDQYREVKKKKKRGRGSVYIAEVGDKTPVEIGRYVKNQKEQMYLKVHQKELKSSSRYIGIHAITPGACDAIIGTMQRIKRQLIREGKPSGKKSRTTRLK